MKHSYFRATFTSRAMTCTTSFVLIIMLLAFIPKQAEAQVDVAAGGAYLSSYLDRGERLSRGTVFQPFVEAEYGRFGGLAFANVAWPDVETRPWMDEINLEGVYLLTDGPIASALGYTFHVFPESNGGLDLPITHEIFLEAALELDGLTPTSLFVYDLGMENAFYAELGLEREFELIEHSLDTGFAIGFDAGFVRPASDPAITHAELFTAIPFNWDEPSTSLLLGGHVALNQTYRDEYGPATALIGLSVEF